MGERQGLAWLKGGKQTSLRAPSEVSKEGETCASEAKSLASQAKSLTVQE